jgi:hypothetical protein
MLIQRYCEEGALMVRFRKVSMLLGAAGFGVVFAVSATSWAGLTGNSGATKESDYTIHAKGLRVGELRMLCKLLPRNDKKVLQFSSTTRIDANFLVYSYALDSREEALVGDEGTIRYTRTTKENDKRSQVEGHLDNGRFLLDIRENGARRTLAVNRERYDYTTMECPEITLRHEGEEKTLRLLDLETLEVVKRTYRWVKSEDVVIDGVKIRCRVIDFEDPNKRCRRWIAPDEVGALIARQDGSGKHGSYSLRIAHLKSGA